MADHYFLLMRTLWMGGMWACLYLVKPMLFRWGFFPNHGLEIINWMVGIGIVLGMLMLVTVALFFRHSLKSRSVAFLISLVVLSFLYFGFAPWWKIQMILGHAISAIGLIWCLTVPTKVLSGKI